MSGTEQASATLAAGGLLTSTEPVPSGEPVDTVHAYCFTHPALADRPVVRLTPAALSAAVELEMQALGFGEAQDLGAVGRQRRRALGFPGWALVNDPERARFALDVYQDFKREARRIRSKPGFAKQGFDEIAARLGGSVPHFLPSFCEEAGRAFIAEGTLSFAAQMFEKAREAERVHALHIDEEVRRDAFLEFALAGAVTIKSISTYGKDLAAARDPLDAYTHYWELCLRRTLGGMPPWGGMAQDLRRMAKAAGLDAAAEDQAVLAGIIDSPALRRAPAAFWKAYRKPLNVLAREAPAVRGTLLNLWPTPSSGEEGFAETWLEILDECGTLAAIVSDDADPAAQPSDGPAAWFSQLVSYTSGGWRSPPSPPAVFELLRRAAARLQAHGQPIRCATKRGTLDLDLCELALDLELPLVSDPDELSVNLVSWAERAEQPERGRDPVRCGGHPELGELIRNDLDRAMGDSSFDRVAQGMEGLRDARREWLESTVEGTDGKAVPGFEQGLERLEKGAQPTTVREFPETHPRLAALRLAPALARTLRGGLFDELGWPALDEVIGSFDDKAKITVSGAFPVMVVSDGIEAVAIGAGGVLLRHELRLPKKAEVRGMRYVQGQLLVCYRDQRWNSFAYWSATPDEVFETAASWHMDRPSSLSVVLDDGSVAEGGRILSAGDHSLPPDERMISDGTTFWLKVHEDGVGWITVEVDPRTGSRGRRSVPAFFAEFTRDGMQLMLDRSWIVPLPEGVEPGSLGGANGLIGVRVRDRDKGSPLAASLPCREVEDMAGEHWVCPCVGYWADGFLRIPGCEPRWTCDQGGRWSSSVSAWINDPATNHVLSEIEDAGDYCMGSRIVAPQPYWSFFVPRDEQGSGALRRVTDEAAGQLLASAVAEHRRSTDPDKPPALDKTRALIGELLPEISHPLLLAGVLGVVDKAARLDPRLEELIATRDPQRTKGPTAPVAGLGSQVILRVMEPIIGSNSFGCTAPVDQVLRGAEAFFSRSDRKDGDRVELEASMVPWEPLIGAAGAVAYVASLASTPADTRAQLLDLLEIWSGTVFLDPGRFRLFRVESEENIEERYGRLFTRNGNDYLLCSDAHYYYRGKRFTVLEHAPDGSSFHGLPEVRMLGEVRAGSEWGRPEQVAALRRALAEQGPRPFSLDDAVAFEEATGVTRAEACLVLAALPGFATYDSNFLPKELREQMGLKVAEAGAGKEALKRLKPAERPAFFAAAVGNDVTKLWAGCDDPEGPAGRLAAAWIERFGMRTPIPEELITIAGKAFGTHGYVDTNPVAALTMVADPRAEPRLTNDGRWTIDKDGDLTAGDEPAFDAASLSVVARYVPLVFSEVAVGNPLRARCADAVDLARARLASPDLLLKLGYEWLGGDDQDKDEEAFYDTLGGTPLSRELSGELNGRDTGLLVAYRRAWQIALLFRPARVQAEEDWDWLAKLYGEGRTDTLRHARLVLSPSFAAFTERLRETPVPEGGYEANPLLSAPEVTADVMQKLGLGEAAATLYLQTLVLPTPTKKDVLRYNDWKPAVYAGAAAELVERGLLIEAKRARAGRAHFLPGGWEALRAPQPPIETWKLPLLGLSRRGGTSALDAPLDAFLPLEPLHRVFAAAWQRICSGDEPRYEEVG